jgi:hypothetical protein
MSTTTATEPHQPESASKIQGSKMHHHPQVLKGYIRKDKDGQYKGICLTLNLAVRGRSLEETETKLLQLIVAYMTDAHVSGTLKELIPRRAPVSYYLEYYRLRVLSHFLSLTDFKLFVRSAPECTAHA